MKFFLEFVACGGSSLSSENRRTAAEETGLMVVQEEPRCSVNGRKQGKGRDGGRHEWRPSLSSISEEALAEETINNVERTAAGWRETLKRKVSSASQRDRSTRSSDREDGRRRTPHPSFIPAFSPTPYMF